MKNIRMALIVSVVALGFVGPALADGLTCNDERGCKLCSGFNSGQFRDTIATAETWSTETCRAYAIAIGTSTWQLACMNKDSFVFGLPQSTANPTPNLPAGDTCGW